MVADSAKGGEILISNDVTSFRLPVSAVRGTRTKPGVLHRDSAQLMNKIGKIRDELCMCSLHVEYVFSVFKMRLRKRTDTRIQNGWLLGRKSEYILTY